MFGGATHRAASSAEPYFEIAACSSRSWSARRTPPAVDDELDPVVSRISCRTPQGTEESRIEVDHRRKLVIEDRGAVGDGTVTFATHTTVLTGEDVDE